MLKTIAGLLTAALAATSLSAQSDAFHTGPVFAELGQIAGVTTTMAIPADAQFAVAFDTATRAEPGEVNRTLNSAARFINMHVAAGVPRENIRLAVVVHGRASLDLTRAEFYAGRQDGAENANAAAIEALLANDVQIILCGQTAAYYEIGVDDLLPGVDMALSAMTAHALLQQDGFTVNPF
ncbi:DsrE family protein [Parasphingopyxis sp.]|uniref:DsrE family protein n=1 Tax=Parasphingopyxis sp. TaxID=1920299 RepID=UPI002625DE44|nr:DsrE family protein [Parasphingopyxis sp.]